MYLTSEIEVVDVSRNEEVFHVPANIFPNFVSVEIAQGLVGCDETSEWLFGYFKVFQSGGRLNVNLEFLFFRKSWKGTGKSKLYGVYDIVHRV